MLELDVSNDEHLARLEGQVREHLGDRIDGVAHPSASAPRTRSAATSLNTPFESVATAMHVSAFLPEVADDGAAADVRAAPSSA